METWYRNKITGISAGIRNDGALFYGDFVAFDTAENRVRVLSEINCNDPNMKTIQLEKLARIMIQAEKEEERAYWAEDDDGIHDARDKYREAKKRFQIILNSPDENDQKMKLRKYRSSNDKRSMKSSKGGKSKMNANYYIEPTESNTFLVRCDSERFGKNAIVYESYSRDACVEYVSQNNAPREWKYYIIPDLKTWASNTPERTPIEYYDTLNEALERFRQLRPQACNAETGDSYAHLTFGMESTKASADLLHVCENQNYLVDDFTRLPELNTDKTVLSALSETARTIGFDRIRIFHKENSGRYASAPVDMAFSEWNNPYFDANKKMESMQGIQRKRNRGVEL